MNKLVQYTCKLMKQAWWKWLIAFVICLIVFMLFQSAYAADPFAAAKTPVKEAIGSGSTVQWAIGGIAATLATVHGVRSRDLWGAGGMFLGTEAVLQVASLIAGLN